MHFNAACFFVEDGQVLELLQLEVGAEFAIDAREKIEIESGGDTDWVVVSGYQCLFGLEHIRAEEQRIAGLENLAQIAKEVGAGEAIEIADGAAEEEDEQMFTRGAAGGDFTQTVEIFALEADDADAIDVPEFTAKNSKRGRRNFNGMIPGGLPARERFEEQARFAARAAAEFGNDDGARKLVDDFPGVQLKQAFFGPREAVFGKGADDFEERRANRIVKILRGQFLLSRLAESRRHFERKLAEERRGGRFCRLGSFVHLESHSLTQRNPA